MFFKNFNTKVHTYKWPGTAAMPKATRDSGIGAMSCHVFVFKSYLKYIVLVRKKKKS